MYLIFFDILHKILMRTNENACDILNTTERYEAKKIPTWEEILTEIRFTDQNFSELPRIMKEWIDTEGACIRNRLDDSLMLAFAEYPREDAIEITKSIIMGCVLTEYRYDSENHLLPFPKRKSEMVITSDGSEAPAPSFLHALSVSIENMKLGVNARVAKASPIHDIAEESNLVLLNGGQLSARPLLDLVTREFSDGNDIAALVDAVTKYETIPGDMEKVIKDHCLYKNMFQRIINQGITGERLLMMDESIMKAISSMLKINLSLLDYTKGDLDKYTTMVAEAYTLKGQDINNNLATPGTKYPIRLRDRIFASYLRIMFSPLADEIMIRMAKNYGDDPIFDGLDMSNYAESQTTRSRNGLKQGAIKFFADQFGVDLSRKKINVGVPILYADEGRPAAVAQIMAFCKPEEIRSIRSGIAANNVSKKLAEFIGQEPGDIHLEVFNGIIENISNIFGRDGIMIRVVKENKDILLMRIVEDKPILAEYALKNRDYSKIAPEEKFIAPNFIAPDDQKRVMRSLITTRTMLLDPSILQEDPSINIYVSQKGLMSCRVDTPAAEIAEKLGTDINNYKIYPILSDTANNSQYPIYHIE